METERNSERRAVAESCLKGAYDASVSFPEIVGALIRAGFDGYSVDYRCNTTTYFHTDGECVVLNNPGPGGDVALQFDPAGVAGQIKWAQANSPGYSYEAFSKNVKAFGCAGYIVSFPGKRVLYFGRTAETHTELFPQ